MIAKFVVGKGFRGATEYDLKKGKGYLLDTNLAGKNPRQYAAEFGAIRGRRTSLTKAVAHVSISAADGETLTDDRWKLIAKRYLEGMGYDDNQYIVTRHTNTKCDHIHIIANRIKYNGSVVSDSWTYPRQEKIMRDIEKDYELTQVKPSREAERRALTSNEIRYQKQTGLEPTKLQLQKLCDAAISQSDNDFNKYQKYLKRKGVDVKLQLQENDTKLNGISYELNGIAIKGSGLGKNYTPKGLREKGIEYKKLTLGEQAKQAISTIATPTKQVMSAAGEKVKSAGEEAISAGMFAISNLFKKGKKKDGNKNLISKPAKNAEKNPVTERKPALIQDEKPAIEKKPVPIADKKQSAYLSPAEKIGEDFKAAINAILADDPQPTAKETGAAQVQPPPLITDEKRREIETKYAAIAQNAEKIAIADFAENTAADKKNQLSVLDGSSSEKTDVQRQQPITKKSGDFEF